MKLEVVQTKDDFVTVVISQRFTFGRQLIVTQWVPCGSFFKITQ